MSLAVHAASAAQALISHSLKPRLHPAPPARDPKAGGGMVAKFLFMKEAYSPEK